MNLAFCSIYDDKTTLYQWLACKIRWLLEQGLSLAEQGNELSEQGAVGRQSGNFTQGNAT
jgi:hypothetical protein